MIKITPIVIAWLLLLLSGCGCDTPQCFEAKAQYEKQQADIAAQRHKEEMELYSNQAYVNKRNIELQQEQADSMDTVETMQVLNFLFK